MVLLWFAVPAVTRSNRVGRTILT